MGYYFSMEIESQPLDSTIITIKLTTHGKYIWSITSSFKTQDYEAGIERMKNIDGKLRDSFPLYTKAGASRVTDYTEEI